MAIEKAMLIRLDQGQEAPTAEQISGEGCGGESAGEGSREGDEDRSCIRVHFNPESLKTSLSTNVRSGSSGSGEPQGQYIERSDSTLSLDLIFDTSIAAPNIQGRQGEGDAGSVGDEEGGNQLVYTDVRSITRRLAEFFLRPSPESDDESGQGESHSGARPSGEGSAGGNEQNQLRPPALCHFRWGRFGFTGMVTRMNETLDYFSPDGIPLRATVSLTLKQDRFQYQVFEDEQAQANARSALEEANAADEREGGLLRDWEEGDYGELRDWDEGDYGELRDWPEDEYGSEGGTQGPSEQSVMADLNDSEHTAGQRPSITPNTDSVL